MKDRDPEVSVCVCTRNRARRLHETLKALQAELPRSDNAEVVVVDNDSTDASACVVSELARADSRIRYAFEEIPGLSRARNAATRLSRGRAIVFLDDDVEPMDGWYEAITRPILSGEADAVAGQIELAPDFDRPGLTQRFRLLFAETPPVGEGPPPLIGANMAFSRAVADSVTFDEELGPGMLGMADDVLFYYQVQAAGFRILQAPAARTLHHPDPDRLAPAALRELAVMNGASHAYIWHHWLHTRLRLLGARRLLAKVRLIKARAKRSRKICAGLEEAEYDAIYWLSFFRRLEHERRRPAKY